MKNFKEKSLYKKSIFIFSLIMAIVGVVFLIYVFSAMVSYEKNLLENYIARLPEETKFQEELKSNSFTISSYEKEKASKEDGIKKLFRSKNLEYKENKVLTKDGVFGYDIYTSYSKIATVTFRIKKSYQRLGILKINEYELQDVDLDLKEGLYVVDVTIPANYKLYVNENLVKEKDITATTDDKNLERLTEFVEINKANVYQLKNFVYDPKIKILDESNKEVTYKQEDDKIVVTKEYKEIADFEEAKKQLKESFDVLGLAKNWSLFLTDDLKGSRHGFDQLTPYLIQGSAMYQLAYDWATNVDITFVSRHYLKNPPFTNEGVKNCILYNENAFSCEVYFDKNMALYSGNTKVDTMHDRMYFVYYQGGYKLVDMEAITE